MWGMKPRNTITSKAGSPVSRQRCCGRSTISGRSIIRESSSVSSRDTSCRLAPVITNAGGTPEPSTGVYSRFFPGRWGFYRPFPMPGALWLYSRHRLTRSAQCRWLHPMPQVRLSIRLQKNRRHTSGGNTGIPDRETRTVRAGRSREYRYGVHNISPQPLCAAPPAAAGSALPNPVLPAISTVPPLPKTPPLFPMNGVVSSFSPPLRN
jgi:hypothetical protein